MLYDSLAAFMPCILDQNSPRFNIKISPALDHREGLGFSRSWDLSCMEVPQSASYAPGHGRLAHLLRLECAHAQPALKAAIFKASQYLGKAVCDGTQIFEQQVHVQPGLKSPEHAMSPEPGCQLLVR